MIVEQLVVGPFQVNTWLVGDAEGGEGFVVDPGGENERLLASIERHGLRIRAILNTHGHIDHIAGAVELASALRVPFRMHEDDRFLLDGAAEACALFGLPPIEAPALDRPLVDGETVRIGSLAVEVVHTPGHSPGGVCLLAGEHAFVGDTLFAGSVGRTDLPGGSTETLRKSIFDRLIGRIPDGSALHCGHGPDTTLAEERATNPFLLAWGRG